MDTALVLVTFLLVRIVIPFAILIVFGMKFNNRQIQSIG